MEQRIIKRCMDISLSILLGIISAPIWLLSAVAIKKYMMVEVYCLSRIGQLSMVQFSGV